jgi:hypothetical protein
METKVKSFRSNTELSNEEIRLIIENYPRLTPHVIPNPEFFVILDSYPKLKEAIEKWEAVD